MAAINDALRETGATIRWCSDAPVCRVRHGDDRIRVDAADAVSAILNLSEAHAVRCRFDGRLRAAEPFVGAVTLVPPGVRAIFDLVGTASVLTMQLPWSAIRREALDEGRDESRVALRSRLAFDDPVLARLLYDAASSVDGGPIPIGSLAARLLGAHDTRWEARAPAIGGLTPAGLRRVRARVEDDIAEPPTVVDLAAEARLSPSHFAREFRRMTGVSPHRYVLRRQLDRAILLLADADMGIADIAAASGFAHASHLARHLRRRTGLSPAAFRIRILP